MATKKGKQPKIEIKEFDPQSMPMSCTWVIIGPPASGKCFAKDTEVLMYDMSVKKVQDVANGDCIMGADSKPRLVGGITHGTEEMYKITNISDGTSYTVNESHILTLYHVAKKELVDIPLKEYLALTFEQQISTYQGCRLSTNHCLPFPFGVSGGTDRGTNGIENAKKLAREHASAILLGKDVTLPTMLLMANITERLSYLFTLIDRTGGFNLSHTTGLASIPIPRSSPDPDKWCRLIRSLGLPIRDTAATKGQQRIFFEFDAIKINHPRMVTNDISVSRVGKDVYYGFTLDGDGRFLLGDFTVTHNTTLMENFAYYLKHKYPVGRVFMGTEDGYKRMCEIFHPLYVNLGWNEEDEKKYCGRQKLCEFENGRGYPGNYGINIIDDCSDDPKIYKTQLMRGLFKLGSQHWANLLMVGSQYAIDMPPDVRKSISYVAIGREPEPIERKKLYENFGGLAGSQEMFNLLMDEICQDHTFMIIRKRSDTNQLEDNIFWYKTRVLGDWKFGSKEYRKHADERYDTGYVEKVGF